MSSEFTTLIIAAITGLLTGVGGMLTGAYKARAESKAAKQSAEQVLIGQLQKELERYRDRTDHRLDELEAQVQAYRSFIGVQRDHMAEHGVPLPPWPNDLPR